jgi:hypothetical protein
MISAGDSKIIEKWGDSQKYSVGSDAQEPVFSVAIVQPPFSQVSYTVFKAMFGVLYGSI